MKRVPKIYAAELDGINAELVEVEADLNVGLHSFNIVGLGDKAVAEAKERVNSALKNSGIKPPTKENRKITINLAPADVKKIGSRFDLAIALAYLLASEQIRPFETKEKMFLGELSLDGELRPINGALNIALLAKRKHIRELYVPEANASEASVVKGLCVFPVKNLKEIIEHLEEKQIIAPKKTTVISPEPPPTLVHIGDIKGNAAAKRALLVAASGGHNIIMSGPPGTGKTMLAQALASILPAPQEEEVMEINQIYSAVGLTKDSFLSWRPFRAPHHTASLVSIIGGGTNPRPGEISLAHRGVLFLDELPEFHRDVLEGLRQPLESGAVHVARAKRALVFPARFQLVAAMNPCPCGYYGDEEKPCKCTANEIMRYQKKLSGPLLDRLDIQLEIPRIPLEELRKKHSEDIENDLRKIIARAREIQKLRFKKINASIYSNAEMPSKIVDELVSLDRDAEIFLKQALEKSFISPRGYYRILKVGQTIADIDGSDSVKTEHLAEAFQYRLKNE